MTKSFDEFYSELELQCLSTHEVGELCFDAGAQSRQDEVDSLEKGWVERKNERDELQKRIDKALIQISNHYHSCIARKNLKRFSASVSEIAEIGVHESSMCVLENILKGKEND